MIFCGIDPGLDGAIAILEENNLYLYRTPVLSTSGGKRSFDADGMAEMLSRFYPDLAVIEKVGAMPGQGVTSMFNFGMGYGIWLGVLAGRGVPHQAVMPAAWKKSILAGTTKDKQAAIQFIQRRFPGESLLATPRSKVPHDGFADAACLALYARQLMNGSSK